MQSSTGRGQEFWKLLKQAALSPEQGSSRGIVDRLHCRRQTHALPGKADGFLLLLGLPPMIEVQKDVGLAMKQHVPKLAIESEPDSFAFSAKAHLNDGLRGREPAGGAVDRG